MQKACVILLCYRTAALFYNKVKKHASCSFDTVKKMQIEHTNTMGAESISFEFEQNASCNLTKSHKHSLHCYIL